jgi:hypothetical protein
MPRPHQKLYLHVVPPSHNQQKNDRNPNISFKTYPAPWINSLYPARSACDRPMHACHVVPMSMSSQPASRFITVGDIRFMGEMCISVAIAFQDASWKLGIA